MPKKKKVTSKALTKAFKGKGFEEKIKPKTIKDPKELFILKCPGCKNIHFRHAGYIEVMIPWVRANKEKQVSEESFQVRVCTVCKRCYVYISNQLYDITKHIDLNAWEKAEKKLHKATGPGGEC